MNSVDKHNTKTNTQKSFQSSKSKTLPVVVESNKNYKVGKLVIQSLTLRPKWNIQLQSYSVTSREHLMWFE